MLPAQPSDRPRLSIAMIVRDEEQVLPGALESVREIADQIVIGDTGSHDQSCRIAASLGAEVFAIPWHDDFSAARNQLLPHATGDWVLWLDAGERLIDRCQAPLREFIDNRPATDSAWAAMIELPPEPAADTRERAARIRLMPNRPDLRFSGRVRESLRPALEAAGLRLQLGPWRIERTEREHSPAFRRARALRNLKLVEIEAQTNGASAGLLLLTGEACAALGQNDKAMAYFRQTILNSERGSTEMLSAYYGLLAAYPPDQAAGNAQLEICIEALEIYPYDAQLLCAMGSYLQTQGHQTLAQRSFRAAHEFGQIDPETWHVSEIGEVAAVCLSLNLQLLGDDAGGLKVLTDAETRYPKSARLARRRLELHVKGARLSDSLAEVDKLGLERESRELLRSAVRGAVVAAQHNWIPALAYLEAAYSGGCRDPLCLRWYSAALFAMGKQAQMGDVLEAWSRIEPHCQELGRYREALQATGSAAGNSPLPRRVPAPHLRLTPAAAGAPGAGTLEPRR